MDARTRKALEASIKHWEENVAAETPWDASTSTVDCALCCQFFDNNCDGCPVASRTGAMDCDLTPFGTAYQMLGKWKLGRATKEQWQEAARAELKFLKSLLPEGDAQ